MVAGFDIADIVNGSAMYFGAIVLVSVATFAFVFDWLLGITDKNFKKSDPYIKRSAQFRAGMYFLAAGMIWHATTMFLSFKDLGDFWVRQVGNIVLFGGMAAMISILSFTTTAATIFNSLVGAALMFILTAAVGLGENTEQRVILFVLFGVCAILHFLVLIKNINSSGMYTVLQWIGAFGYAIFVIAIGLLVLLGPDVTDVISRNANYGVDCGVTIIFTWGLAFIFGLSFYLVEYKYIIFFSDGSSEGLVVDPKTTGLPAGYGIKTSVPYNPMTIFNPGQNKAPVGAYSYYSAGLPYAKSH